MQKQNSKGTLEKPRSTAKELKLMSTER